MQRIRFKNIFPVAAIAVFCASLVSCTKDFDRYNTDPTKLTELGNTEFPYLFSKAQVSASYQYYRYQVAENLFADMYAQFFAITATYFPSDRYVMRDDWLITHWLPIYTETVPQLRSIIEQTEETSAQNALAKIWWVYSFHRLTDYYGPVPYFHAGESLKSVPYDAQDQIYDDFFKKLADAVAVLKTHLDEKPFGNFDLLYKGDVPKWIKFANTLRLRLALRVSNVDPARAKTEAEAAVAEGVLTDIADDAYMLKSGNGTNFNDYDYNGLAGIAVWDEFRMSASMESVLKGYEDPRMPVYFQPATATGQFDGHRNGLNPNEQGVEANTAPFNSNVGQKWARRSGNIWEGINNQPQDIMHAAEAYFLRAEGALNGWNMGGTAQQLYETGIASSMMQSGITDGAVINAYISGITSPVAPGDATSAPALSDIPVKWGGSEAVQREQVGTQKWLALFPDGMEAWAEFRRTRFPRLYPVVHSDNTDVPAGDFIRRIPFIDVEKQNNKEAVNAAVQLLQGPDNASTPLWWDTN